MKLGFVKELPPSCKNRYGKNLHEVRDLSRTRWERAGLKKDGITSKLDWLPQARFSRFFVIVWVYDWLILF